MSHFARSVRRVVSSFPVAPKALFVAGALAATVTGATLAVPATAQASSGLRYHKGYSLQHGWYCYGWTNGAYHCTHHWLRTRSGQVMSLNTRWVPNYLSTKSPTSTRNSAPARHVAVNTAKPRPVSRPASQPSYGGANNLGRAAIISEIRSVFGPYAYQALAIASCESSFNPYAYNPTPVGGAHAEGVFQILNTSTWYTTSYRWASPYNASANIHAAYEIFHRDGNSWREWACRP
ncbi:MAG TPA: transglycosylase SLT domain-containing protein [Ktedonobacterales bacterium]